MSKNYGYIKVFRDIQEHYLWQEKPFDKARAWLDLVMLANHTDKKLMVNGKLKVIKRGQIFTSRKKLAEKWGWSTKKVDGFINLLKTDKMVTTEGTAEGTTLTVENYGLYQSEGDTVGVHQKDSRGDTRGDSGRDSRGDTNKKDNKEKKDKKENIYNAPIRHKHGEYGNVFLSDEDFEKLKSEFPADYKDRIEQLSSYMESTGKSYKNHLATIRNWSKRDAVSKTDTTKKKPGNANPPSYDLDKFKEQSLHGELKYERKKKHE